jgi:SAM-dependent methyltransferase
MTKATLTADWLDNRAQNGEYLSTDNDVDRDYLYHYICKSILNGNFSCPLDNSMENVLQIAYSSGYWMMEMATDFPKTKFYGIDLESNAPDLVYPKNCIFGQGDYLKGLPYQDNFFDMVRLDMIHLRSLATPEQVSSLLSEVFRVVKKGGYVEFLQPEYSSPEYSGPLLKKLIQICVGNDLKIDELLIDSGFVNVTNTKVAIPLGNGSMVGEFSLAAIKSFIDEDGLYLVEKESENDDSHINIFSGFGQKL